MIIPAYRRLHELFNANLSDARAWRIGNMEIDVIIFSRASDGRWVGLKTRAVETSARSRDSSSLPADTNTPQNAAAPP
jgi:hypothetical protein